MSLEEIRQARIKKLEKLKELGINPYPAKSEEGIFLKEAIDNFDNLAKGGTVINLAGRITAKREHGGSLFFDIFDGSEKLQAYLKQDRVGEDNFKIFEENIDIGDFIEIKGAPFYTKKNEKTIEVLSWRILTKSLRPLPEKWHGLQDIEERFRKRYLDLIMNKEVREIFKARSRFIDTVRNYLKENGFFDFLEVETPILEDVPGGAEAEPFITHHNYLDKDFYLRISLELHLKRLIVGGYQNIFEIGKVFRNEGMDREHLQEFTLLEFYSAYKDYKWLMDFVERFYSEVMKEVFGSLKPAQVDFTPSWPRIDYFEIFKEKTGIGLYEILEQGGGVAEALLAEQIKKLNLDSINFEAGAGRMIDQVYKRLVRPGIKGPAFLIHHPVIISPLAKRKEDEPQKTERFQILIDGSEIGNGFSELNDPLEQRARFEEQMKLRAAGDKEAQIIDEDFLIALEHGMPPTAGFGVGLDRLFMAAAGIDSIRETIFFPMMK